MGNRQVYALFPIYPRPHISEACAFATSNVQVTSFAAEDGRCAVVDPSVPSQAYHIAPTRVAVESGVQHIAREGPVGQQCDRPEFGQKLVHLLLQGDRDRGADAATVLPQHRNGPSMCHNRDCHNAEVFPEPRNVQAQM